MTIDRWLAIFTSSVRGLHCPHTSQNLIRKPSMKSRYSRISYSFFYCSILSNGPTAHHYITWHLGNDNKLFLARILPFFNFQWNIFKKCQKLQPDPPGSNYRPQAARGPIQHYQWPAEAFMKKFQIWNMLKSAWGYIYLTEFLALDKVHLHKNNEEYLFCVPLLFWFYVFIYFTIELEGRLSDNPPLEHITGQALCSSLPQLSLS